MVNNVIKEEVFKKLNEYVTDDVKEDWDKYNESIIELAEKLIKITQASPFFEDPWGMTDYVENDLINAIQIMAKHPGYEYDSKPADVWERRDSL